MDIQKAREKFAEINLKEGFYTEEELSITDLGVFEYTAAEQDWEKWWECLIYYVEPMLKAQAVLEWFDYTKQSPQMDGNYQIFIKGEQITAKWVSRFGFADPIEGDALRQELITHWAMQPQSPKAQEPAK